MSERESESDSESESSEKLFIREELMPRKGGFWGGGFWGALWGSPAELYSGLIYEEDLKEN